MCLIIVTPVPMLNARRGRLECGLAGYFLRGKTTVLDLCHSRASLARVQARICCECARVGDAN